ncbi:MAG TPA: hypothetical protein VGJ84_09855 [Polyangiaceae bacterium]
MPRHGWLRAELQLLRHPDGVQHGNDEHGLQQDFGLHVERRRNAAVRRHGHQVPRPDNADTLRGLRVYLDTVLFGCLTATVRGHCSGVVSEPSGLRLERRNVHVHRHSEPLHGRHDCARLRNFGLHLERRDCSRVLRHGDTVWRA